jgi:hypothetical protein
VCALIIIRRLDLGPGAFSISAPRAVRFTSGAAARKHKKVINIGRAAYIFLNHNSLGGRGDSGNQIRSGAAAGLDFKGVCFTFDHQPHTECAAATPGLNDILPIISGVDRKPVLLCPM